MKKFTQKLKSRKLITALIGIIAGIAVTFGIDGGEISTVAGTVMSLCSAVAYIITEGKIDASSVKSSKDADKN